MLLTNSRRTLRIRSSKVGLCLSVSVPVSISVEQAVPVPVSVEFTLSPGRLADSARFAARPLIHPHPPSYFSPSLTHFLSCCPPSHTHTHANTSGTAADLLQAGVEAGESAAGKEDDGLEGAALKGQEMKVNKARTQSLFLEGSGNGANGDAGMPWLAPYFGQHGFQNHDDNVKWGEAAEKAAEPVQQLADPLWCGAASCAEHRCVARRKSLLYVMCVCARAVSVCVM